MSWKRRETGSNFPSPALRETGERIAAEKPSPTGRLRGRSPLSRSADEGYEVLSRTWAG
jgi:hypothetical protein